MITNFEIPEAHAVDDWRSRAELAGVDSFTDFHDEPQLELDLTIEGIRQRADTMSELLESILQRSVLPPHWRINE